jgi:hypothetical protein
MRSIPLLSKIDSHVEVCRYLEWHFEKRIPVRLMFGSSDGHLPAYVTGLDHTVGTIDVVCLGVRKIASRSAVSYAVIGSSASGDRFLASGQMYPDPSDPASFKLGFPKWLDVSQSRDGYRCTAPSGHFLHFSSTDPHLNDVICRVRDVSLGGLGVECESLTQLPALSVGAPTDNAILQSHEDQVHLGRLRVAHITHKGQTSTIGLSFDKGVPREFTALALNAQRTHYLL